MAFTARGPSPQTTACRSPSFSLTTATGRTDVYDGTTVQTILNLSFFVQVLELAARPFSLASSQANPELDNPIGGLHNPFVGSDNPVVEQGNPFGGQDTPVGVPDNPLEIQALLGL